MIKVVRIAVAMLLLAVLAAPAGWAQSTDAGTAAEELSRKERKQRAKEARIEEYLRKREERRARRDLQRQERAAAEAEAAAARARAAEAAAAEPQPTAAQEAEKPAKRARAERDTLPRGLARVQEVVANSQLGGDPTVAAYLEHIARGTASAHQIAAFGNFLGEAGMGREAIAYYALAVDLAPDDSLLWLNLGTLHRQIGERDQAAGAYARALSMDPNNALAHYNLGAVLDEDGRYDEALEEYKIALTLDPTLGDPKINPQAANNERLLAVKLLLYREQTGSLGTPLVEVPDGALETE